MGWNEDAYASAYRCMLSVVVEVAASARCNVGWQWHAEAKVSVKAGEAWGSRCVDQVCVANCMIRVH